MKKETIDQLLQQGLLSELDIQFGRFVTDLSGKGSVELFLAAALVSHSQGEGHICLDLSAVEGKGLMEESTEPLTYPGLKPWLKILETSPVVGKPDEFKPLILDGSKLYLYRYWNYERRLADALKQRMQADHPQRDEKVLREGLNRLFPGGSEKETDWQKVAAFTSVVKRLCVISGGPGTGKTYTVAKILALLKEQAGPEKLRIGLAAPTGKASARLQEAIRISRENLDCPDPVKAALGGEASTIHRLLGTLSGSPYFQHNAKNPLPLDVLVVDEASMVDLALLSKLAEAVPSGAHFILLGDKDQLASVEAGAVLGDICDTGHVHGFSKPFREAMKRVTGENIGENRAGSEPPGPADCIVELKKSYRFGRKSGIGAVSRAVNEGDSVQALDLLRRGDTRDIEWRELPRPDRLAHALKDRIIAGFTGYLRADDPRETFDLFSRFRILCALRDGPYGVHSLNLLAEQILKGQGLIKKDDRWYHGRPILITRNDYNLNLFNGDIGIILEDPDAHEGPRAFFQAADGTLRNFPPLRLPEHETVYAMTVHKSQGSEFDQVLFILPDKVVPVLTRELVYTGMTRAKEKSEVWGKEEVFRSAVARRIERASGLRDALWG